MITKPLLCFQAIDNPAYPLLPIVFKRGSHVVVLSCVEEPVGTVVVYDMPPCTIHHFFYLVRVLLIIDCLNESLHRAFYRVKAFALRNLNPDHMPGLLYIT